MKRNKISIYIITYNEEKDIRKCLENIKDIADEIVIVDSFSTDNTVKICKEYTDKVYLKKWENDFSLQKNYCASKASGDWLLYTNPDVIFPEELKKEIKEAINNPKYKVYQIPTKHIIGDEWIKSNNLWPDYHKSLYLKSINAQWTGKVHGPLNWGGKVGTLKNPKIYYGNNSYPTTIKKLYSHWNGHIEIESDERVAKFSLMVLIGAYLSFVLRRMPQMIFKYFFGSYKDGVVGLKLLIALILIKNSIHLRSIKKNYLRHELS